MSADGVGFAIVDGEFHSAGDVDADRVRNHCIVRREHAADWESVADVGVGHECPGDRDRERTGVRHLFHRFRFEALTPLAPRCEIGTWRKRWAVYCASQLSTQPVGEERSRVGYNVEEVSLELCAVVSLRDEVLDELVRELERLAEWNAQANQVFRVHDIGKVDVVVSEAEAGQAAVFVLLVMAEPMLVPKRITHRCHAVHGLFRLPYCSGGFLEPSPNTKERIMNQLPLFDVAVIGGGLGGLTAAIYAARAGRTVIVFEKSPQAGGRASTQNVDGFHFNQGPHALYRGGHGIPILRELGISYEGAQASYAGSWAVRVGEKHPLPGTPEVLLSTPLLTEVSRQEAIALFGSLGQIKSADWNHVSLRHWLDTQIQNEDVRDLFEGMFRLATYCADAEVQSAGAALEQIIMAREGVDYLDGGWQALVDRMRDAAMKAGVRIETRSPVGGLHHDEGNAAVELASGDWYSARSVISTIGPSFIMRLVNDGTVPSLRQWADEAVPIHAGCLDIALRRLPNPEHQFAIGLDRSLYYSVHTRSAKLAPANGAVIQLAKYLRADSTQKGSDLRKELEDVMDWLQPGWREVLVTDRFLPRMLVANAVATAAAGGTPGRPTSIVPEIPNLFLAGDWVGPHGMLVDASLSSARDAAKLALRWLDGANVVSQADLTTV